MDFGSEYIYYYDDSEEEDIECDEYNEPLHVSGGSSGEGEVLEEGGAQAKAEKKKSKKKRSSPTKKPQWRVDRDCRLAKSLSVPGGPAGATASRMTAAAPECLAMRAQLLALAQPTAPPPPAAADPLAGPPRVKKTRRADTNVIVVRFDALSKPSAMHAGDPTYCGSCGVILTKISPLTSRGEDKIWTCEFCGVENVVDVESEEIPQKEDVTFMLEPAAATTAAGKSGADDILVVFCVDVSGSMCVTTELPGHHNLRGSERAGQINRRFNEFREPQYLPNERRNVTYVTRLQALQAAVDHQIKQMAKDFPDRRPVLVAFNSEVTLIGDGTKDPIVIAGDKLKDKETLLNVGSEQLLPTNVKQSQRRLSQKLFELEEGGGTCLGPALIISLAIAGQRPGSKVILCTDGKANVGLGSLESLGGEKLALASEFYNDVSAIALERSVSVSVISIKGTDCKLVELAKVAATTGGHVDTVDTLKLTSEFSNILAENVIATNVKATLFLHSHLYFRDESDMDSKIVRDVGNVTKSTEVTFEYGIRRRKPSQATSSMPEDPTTSGPQNPGSSGLQDTAPPRTLDTVIEESITSCSLLDKESEKFPEASSSVEPMEVDTESGTPAQTEQAAADVTVEKPHTSTPAQTEQPAADVTGEKPQTSTTAQTATDVTGEKSHMSEESEVPEAGDVKTDDTCAPVAEASQTEAVAEAGKTEEKPDTATSVEMSEPAPSAACDVTEARDQPESRGPDVAAGTSDELRGATAASPKKKEEELKDVPFQIHICYTDIDGARAMRVITQKKPVTRDRTQAERALNMDVLGINMLQQTSSHALGGRYMAARSNLLSNQRMMSSHTYSDHSSRPEYERLFNKCKKLDSKLHSQMMTEREKTGTYSDDEYDDASCRPVYSRPKTVGFLPTDLTKRRSVSERQPPKQPEKMSFGHKLMNVFSRRAKSTATSKCAQRMKTVDDESSAMFYNMASKPSKWLDEDSSDDESEDKK